MPGGGFALSNYRSFEPAILHQFIYVPAFMTWRTYNYVDYSPTDITLPAEGNWLKLTTVTSSASPSAYKVLISTPRSFCKTVSVVATSSASWPNHKAATPTPQSSHKTVVLAAAASSAPWSSYKAATLTPRPYLFPQDCLCRRCCIISLLKDQEEIKEGWPDLPGNHAPQPSGCSASAAQSSLRRLSLRKLTQ
ncbi:hypothetical protein ACLOJK_035001 [Asimina triloba]